MPLQAIEMVLANCPKLTMAAEELYDAYSTVELDASGYPNTGISQSDFVLLRQAQARLQANISVNIPEALLPTFAIEDACGRNLEADMAASQPSTTASTGGEMKWNVHVSPILIYPFAVAGLISPEVAILIFRTTGRHLLGHEAPRLNLQQFESVALLCVIMAANLTPQGFVECFEAGRCATFSTLWGSNTSTHIDSDSDPSSVFCIDQRPKVRKGNMSMSFERRYNSATRLPCIVEEDVNSLENL
eukprot:gene12098-15209_t